MKILASQIAILCTMAVSAMASAGTTVSSQSSPIAASATHGTDSVTDSELSKRVQAALRSAPYVYDKHVSVSVENGNVVLRGFVLDQSDLLDTLRIADRAAGNRQVIDKLSIKLNGGRY
jgi:osmotically-inducible protein OsmY